MNTTETTINYDDFARVDLRVATIISCEPHPNADKLLLLQVDLGDQKRQLCAGLRAHYDAQELVGKQVIVVANLAPRVMRGQESQGMLLAASDPDGRVVVLQPAAAVAPGSKVS
jgi:tRNA-binding protein